MNKAEVVFEKLGALNFKHILNTYIAPGEREGVRLLSKGIAVIKHPNVDMQKLQKSQVVDRIAKKFSLNTKESPNFYVLTEGTPKKAPGLSMKAEKINVITGESYNAHPSDRAKLHNYRRAFKQGYDPNYEGWGRYNE